jgi:tRNA pseudouridine55 synthase
VSGVLRIDKPAGMTSHDVVSAVKRRFRFAKVGHCGTLDPFATGLLVLCLNRATRIADLLTAGDKTYHFALRLGVETDTLDHTGRVVRRYTGEPLPREALEHALGNFRGHYRQQVPQYAAVKVQGKPLHAWSRQAVAMTAPSREVFVRRLDLLDYQWPEVIAAMECSKGTYVRQLAADLGAQLSCGAHVQSLRRLASGGLRLEDAVALETLTAMGLSELIQECLVDANEALAHLPAVVVGDRAMLAQLRDGHLDPVWVVMHQRQFAGNRHTAVRLVTARQRLLALWWPFAEKGERQLRVIDISTLEE